MKRVLGWAVGLSAMIATTLVAASAAAADVQYDLTVTADGSLNGVSFSNAAVDFQLTGDPSTLSLKTGPFGGQFESIDPLDSAQVTIAGVGTTAFSTAMRLGMSTNVGGPEVLFLSPAGDFGLDILDLFLSVDFQTFDFAAPQGPIAAFLTFPPNGSQDTGLATGAGPLTFTAFSSGAFSISDAAAAVPEPGIWGLMLIGFATLGARLRTARRHALVSFGRRPNPCDVVMRSAPATD
jgi:hypothetical protein